MKTRVVVVSLIILIILAIIVFSLTNSEESIPEKSSSTSNTPILWKGAELRNILTGETYIISNFEKPVLLESFAVWCPICTQQQKEMQKLHEKLGDSVISISLDTDPNEDEQKILSHTKNHGFDWIYSISPPEVTQSLINEFGIGIVNAPSAPVLLVCESGASRFLERDLKSAEKLEEEINKGC